MFVTYLGCELRHPDRGRGLMYALTGVTKTYRKGHRPVTARSGQVPTISTPATVRLPCRSTRYRP